MLPGLHKDPVGFRAALEFTSHETGFRTDLIEKDYYCSLLLAFIFQEPNSLVFKGGTSLNKVHVGFYRLSEDLDFSIPINSDATREARRSAIKPIKDLLSNLEKKLPEFQIRKTLTGSNESRQYNSELEYTSISTGSPMVIKVEVGLREPLLTDSVKKGAGTMLLDPYTGQSAVVPVNVHCLSKDEAYSEKVRAALTRVEPAIRDWFDLDHAVSVAGFILNRADFLKLVKKKLAIPGTGPSQSGSALVKKLQAQLKTELRPVLREKDYIDFNLERALSSLEEIRKALTE